MLKNFTVFLFIATALYAFVLISETEAFSFNKSFAGKIIANEAKRITELKDSGYECTVPGSTIEVKTQSISMPKSYFLAKNKDGKLPINKNIMGSYAGKTEITCILQAEPPLVEVVILDTIKRYGVPRKY